MPALIRVWLVLVLATGVARADAGAGRVVLADGDLELRRAITSTLAPWHLEVVVDAAPITDAAEASARAGTQTARFVVWRRDGELVVFDRERGEAERRVAPGGPLDAATAAAAALTVKTLMRLPPPPAETLPEGPAVGVHVRSPPAASGFELRLQVGAGSRIAGGDAGAGVRASLTVMVRPSDLPLRIGLAGEAGPADDVDRAGFKGTWRDQSVLAVASWAFGPFASRWEIEPFVAGGVERSALEGSEMAMMTGARNEHATLALLRGGVWVRARLGWFSAGAALAIDKTVGTPTYTKTGTGSRLFDVPPSAFAFGLMVAADLGW